MLTEPNTIHPYIVDAVASQLDMTCDLELHDVALVDPPWQNQGGEKHYPTMSLRRIIGMRDAIRAHMKPDSWLFLWTTKSLVEEAKHVLKEWGYEYGESITWGKLNRYGYGNKRIGVRRATEILLIGTRGNVVSDFRAQPDWFASPAGRHAEKPLEQYAIIERIAGADARVLELFARVRRPDPRYSFWGNELDRCDVNFAPWGYPVPADQPIGVQVSEEGVGR
ncbi:MT-A70 family methyltransferase [Leucobacter sp. NPDC077196]|uniref:MT-A70 family methyltransferase n=1 Tax=Leucobacter sp. NPDC077196 TaxID=3154959 RepID=UPI00343A59B9